MGAVAIDLPRVNPVKQRLAGLLERSGALGVLDGARSLRRGPHIRVVNYHTVPPFWADDFARQLAWYQEHFVPVGWKELLDLQEGNWLHDRPGLLISFDDGCRTHAEVAAPLLERFGFVGWFFVPGLFPDVAEAQQAEFARAHQISAWSDGEDRLALSWEQVGYLDRHHVVGCHTLDHVRLAEKLGEAELRRQVVAGKHALEDRLGHSVDSFAWVGGEEWSYSRLAARWVRSAGFQAAFGTNNRCFYPGDDPLMIERTNVEANYDLPLLRFQLSGILDLAYARKRRRLRPVLSG